MADGDRQETFESIPWERLLADPRDRRRRIMTIAALGLAVLAVSSSLARSLWPVSGFSSPGTTVDVARSEAPVVSTAPATTGAALPSEADLMAIGEALPTGASPEGVAAWFLSAYFGSDPAAAVMLPVGLELPQVDSRVRSFVDSVHILSTRFDDAAATVVAIVRLLIDSGGGYRRSDPLVVEVDLEPADDGWVVSGPPRPVSLDLPRLEQNWEAVPPGVGELAGEAASEFGDVVEVGPGRLGETGRWVVVVMVDLGAAGVWPLSVDVEAS